MPWSTGGVGIAGRLPGAEAEAPIEAAWQPWLDLLDVSLGEPASVWDTAVTVCAERLAGAPLLHGASIHLDDLRARLLVRRLAQVAGISTGAEIDASQIIRAAITRDDARLAEMAERCGVSAGAFTVVAQVAAMPLLLAAARTLDVSVARAWQRGYCPVCGAWPSLAEVRGIERERRLRCGCCSADWQLPFLHCAFCDEGDHEKLGSLLPEGEERMRYVETCESCHGYLKAMATVDALPVRALVLLDLSTIPLDLVAHDRGYARPARAGWALSIEVAS
jgi:FdhE protein